jgi:hypothetical protein
VAVRLVEATIQTSIASSLLPRLPWTDLVGSTDSSCLVQQQQLSCAAAADLCSSRSSNCPVTAGVRGWIGAESRSSDKWRRQ